MSLYPTAIALKAARSMRKPMVGFCESRGGEGALAGKREKSKGTIERKATNDAIFDSPPLSNIVGKKVLALPSS